MIEPTKDLRRVKRILDANPMKGMEPWLIDIHRDHRYFLEVQDGEDKGAWCVHMPENKDFCLLHSEVAGKWAPRRGPEDHDFALLHSAMNENFRGARVVESGLRLVAWVFDNTDVQVVFGAIPIELKHAYVIPRVAGFKCFGNHSDLRYYGMDREMFGENERVKRWAA